MEECSRKGWELVTLEEMQTNKVVPDWMGNVAWG